MNVDTYMEADGSLDVCFDNIKNAMENSVDDTEKVMLGQILKNIMGSKLILANVGFD